MAYCVIGNGVHGVGDGCCWYMFTASYMVT
jgi:hypothetical protein